MNPKFHYDTISEAINQLRAKGYSSDFIFSNGVLKAGETEFHVNELEIDDLYRYEGDSDPADESTVFALSATTGTKGIFVAGYGPSAEDGAEELIKHLHYKYSQNP
jgi:hypothetical protein